MGYQENPDHVPNPMDASGTLDTSGVGGRGQHSDLRGVSGVFGEGPDPAELRERRYASVHPNDDDPRRVYPENPSPFPEGTIDASDVLSPEEILQRVDPGRPDLPPEAYTTDAQGNPLPAAEIPQDQEFDPADHTVPEVKEHLAGADEDEQQRVVAEEEAGKQRKGVIGEYDPGEHVASDVNAYLAAADEAERERVLEAERAGKNRKSIVG